MNRIIDNLWIGNLGEASRNYLEPKGGKFLIDVRWPTEYEHEPYNSQARLAVSTTTCSIDDKGNKTIIADEERMWLVADILNTLMPYCPTLIHCALGMERSPLTVVWYLMAHRGMPLEEAYELVTDKHPPTLYRGEWLPRWVREKGVLK